MSAEGPERRVIAGRYVLQGLLGQGGMADVELAYDEVLDRQVAVKMLHERHTGDEKFLARFRREAQSAAALNHPNVVGVYDTGAENGRPYIVMEYVSGRSLRQVMDEGQMLPRRAAEVAADAAEALHAAHGRGIVHRDIKPANIMLGDDGRVKVTDFGIARAVNVNAQTQTGSIFGTAAYVAPEQAQGEEVDGRTDIYALGCVLYEMLTGRQPFSGDTAVTLAYKHVSETPVAPRELNQEIPAALEAVVMKAMEKAPSARYQTGEAFAADLKRAIAGQQVSAAAGYAATQALPRQQAAAAAAAASRRPDPTLIATTEERGPRPRPAAGASGAASDDFVDADRSSLARAAAYAFLIVLVAALAGVAWFLFSGLLDDSEPEVTQVQVPAVVGLDIESAQQIIADAGLQPELGPPEPDPTAPPNSVLRTEPGANTLVDLRSTVILIRSEGPALITIPDVAGLTPAEAEQLLVDAGLRVSETREEPDADVEPGRVSGTLPRAGIQVEQGAEGIVLIIAAETTTFRMPDVVDLTEEDARERIENACDIDDGPCARVFVTTDASIRGDGRVIRTDPAAGEEVEAGDAVTVTLSLDASQTPTPEPEPTETDEPEPTPTPTPTRDPEPEPTPEPQPTPTAAPQPPPPAPAPPPPAPPPPDPAPAPPPPVGRPTTTDSPS